MEELTLKTNRQTGQGREKHTRQERLKQQDRRKSWSTDGQWQMGRRHTVQYAKGRGGRKEEEGISGDRIRRIWFSNQTKKIKKRPWLKVVWRSHTLGLKIKNWPHLPSSPPEALHLDACLCENAQVGGCEAVGTWVRTEGVGSDGDWKEHSKIHRVDPNGIQAIVAWDSLTVSNKINGTNIIHPHCGRLGLWSGHERWCPWAIVRTYIYLNA